MEVELIYCAGGNRRFAAIAIEHGFTYGAQLPCTTYFPPEFADQNWRQPDLRKYLEAIIRHRPRIATVLDWERLEQLNVVLDWAEVIAPYVEEIVIVPKVMGGIRLLPRRIGGKPIRLAYSVPTRFGGTAVPYHEFIGWPVHLLGGSPLKQRSLTKYLSVVSLDGNYHQSMAVKYNQFFVANGSATYASNRFWPTLREWGNGKRWGNGSNNADAPYEAFSRSCKAICDMWKGNVATSQPRLL